MCREAEIAQAWVLGAVNDPFQAFAPLAKLANAPDPNVATCPDQGLGCIIVTIFFSIARAEGNARTLDFLDMLPWCGNQ